MIQFQADIAPLEQRITFFDVQERNCTQLMQEIGQLLIEDTLRSLDEGGSPTPFLPTKKTTGRPPLGGSSGSIGQSVHLAELDNQSVAIEASGLPYNVIHQLGGIIKHPGSTKFQAWESFVALELRPSAVISNKWNRLKGGSHWEYRPHGTPAHDIPIPARRYMRFRDDVVERIKELFLNFFMRDQ